MIAHTTHTTQRHTLPLHNNTRVRVRMCAEREDVRARARGGWQYMRASIVGERQMVVGVSLPILCVRTRHAHTQHTARSAQTDRQTDRQRVAHTHTHRREEKRERERALHTYPAAALLVCSCARCSSHTPSTQTPHHTTPHTLPHHNCSSTRHTHHLPHTHTHNTHPCVCVDYLSPCTSVRGLSCFFFSLNITTKVAHTNSHTPKYTQTHITRARGASE
jgi:hypothetical protein